MKDPEAGLAFTRIPTQQGRSTWKPILLMIVGLVAAGWCTLSHATWLRPIEVTSYTTLLGTLAAILCYLTAKEAAG